MPISSTNHVLFILQPEKFSHVMPTVYFLQVVLLCRGAKVVLFGIPGPDIKSGRWTFLIILVF